MSLGELEPVDDESALVMSVEAICADVAWAEKGVRRVPELGTWADLNDLGYLDRRESWNLHRWYDWIEELDEMDADALAADLEECAEYVDGAGWVEDAYGGATYVEPM